MVMQCGRLTKHLPKRRMIPDLTLPRTVVGVKESLLLLSTDGDFCGATFGEMESREFPPSCSSPGL